MSNLGNINNSIEKNKKTISTIRHSYFYKLIRRILSLVSTILLILLLILGASMYYFNMKQKAAEKQGIQYNPPFGLYTIISGSMEPKIHVYDVVASKDVNDLSKLKVGDVITFVSTWEVNYGSTVTHRIIAVSRGENGEYRFTTKGDANQLQDGDFVTRNNLIGKVVLRLPQLGRLQFFLATKIGWFVVVFIPALAVIVWDIVKIFKLKVLKDNISEIENADNAKKIVFENEKLDSRDIGEADLTNTVMVSNADVKEKAKEVTKKPIKKRTVTTKKTDGKKTTKK